MLSAKFIYESGFNYFVNFLELCLFFKVLDPNKRLGASDPVGYPSLRSHPFFAGINFETLHEQTPPPIYPYLPGTSEHEELRSQYRVSWNSQVSYSTLILL